MVARAFVRAAAVLALALLPVSAFAQGTIIPFVSQAFYDSSGNPLSGGKLCTYAAGTTTAQSTYSDVTLATPNANPIILSANGRPTTGAIFLSATSYKFVLLSAGSDATCSTGTTQWTLDNVTATPTSSGNVDVTGTAGESLAAGDVAYLSDGSGGQTAGRWYKADADFTYASSAANVIGIAPTAISSAASGSIRVGGRATGLSGLSAGGVYYVSATAGALTATQPTNTWLFGKADTTTSLIIGNAGALRPPPAQTSTSTGTVNDFATTSARYLLLRLNNASLLTITGFTAGTDGDVIDVVSIGAGQVDFAHQNAGSTAANRLINVATTGNTSLGAGVGTARFTYDATTARWRLVAHEQGAWITPTFAAGSYTAIAAMTWTVGSGDVTHNRYILRGRTVTWELTLDTTTVGGTPSTELRATIPGGFTANGPDAYGPALISDNGATRVWAAWEVTAATFIRFYVAPSLAGNWTAATDATRVYAVMTFEVS